MLGLVLTAIVVCWVLWRGEFFQEYGLKIYLALPSKYTFGPPPQAATSAGRVEGKWCYSQQGRVCAAFYAGLDKKHSSLRNDIHLCCSALCCSTCWRAALQEASATNSMAGGKHCFSLMKMQGRISVIIKVYFGPTKLTTLFEQVKPIKMCQNDASLGEALHFLLNVYTEEHLSLWLSQASHPFVYFKTLKQSFNSERVRKMHFI